MKKSIVIIVLLLAVGSFTSCRTIDGNQNVTQTIYPSYDEFNTAINNENDIGEPFLNEYQTRISIFKSSIKANGKNFDCEVFLYNIDNETQDTINGLTAIELSYNGTVLDRKNIYTNCGIVKPIYPKIGSNEFWSILPLKNDVVAFMSPAADGYSDSVFITVNTNEKLEWITRHYSEEELKENLLENFTIPELRFFTITNDYEVYDNNVIFNHANGNFSVSFDFENYQLLCRDKEHESIVYYH